MVLVGHMSPLCRHIHVQILQPIGVSAIRLDAFWIVVIFLQTMYCLERYYYNVIIGNMIYLILSLVVGCPLKKYTTNW